MVRRASCPAAALALAALVVCGCATATDLGAIGPVHPIEEPDLLDMISEGLRAKQASGELDRLLDQGRRRIRARIDTPPPVPGLRRAQVARQWLFDPSIRVDEAIVDHRGRVVVPAGTVRNPLTVATLRSALLIFDGRDPAQVALARGELDAARQAQRAIKPILVGGSPNALARAWHQPVYFDQHGELTQRFGLSAVPVRITQQGLALRVEELVPAATFSR